MCDWCKDTIGFGTWLGGTPKTWVGLEKLLWSVDSTFGQTTFAFKQEKHYTLFLLKWL